MQLPWDITFYWKISKQQYERGDYFGAKETLTQALVLSQQQGNRADKSGSLNNLGNVSQALGDYAQALFYYTQSLGLQRALGDRAGESKSLHNLGIVSQALGDHAQERDYYKQSLILQRALGDRAGEGRNLNGLGIVSKLLGDYAQARDYHEQSLAIKKALGDRAGEGASLENLGGVVQDLGDYSQARDYFEQSLAIAKELGDRARESTSLNSLGTVSQAIGDYTVARDYYEQSLTIKRDLGSRAMERISLGNLGDVYLELGQFKDALARYQQSNNSMRMGFYHLRQRDFSKALGQFLKDLEQDETSRVAEIMLSKYIGLGLANEGLKDYPQSRIYFQKAVDLIETQRDKLNPNERRQFLGGKVFIFKRLEAYEGLARVSLAAGKAEEALYWAEHTKARLFLEALARRESSNQLKLPENLAKRESEVSQRIMSLGKQQDAAFNAKNTELFNKLEPELAKAKKERTAFVAELRREQPAYAAVAYPQPLAVADWALQPGEVVLEYEVTDSATLAWLVRDGKVLKSLTVPISRKDLDDEVKRYRGFFEVTDMAQLARFDPKLGQTLYEQLFKDFAPLLKETDSLIIVPDDVLGILPFEALVAQLPAKVQTVNGKYGAYPSGVGYLGDRYHIRYAQSATALVQTRTLQKPRALSPQDLLVLADPVFDAQDVRAQAEQKQGKPLLLVQREDAPFKLMSSIRDWQGAQGASFRFERLDRFAGLPEKLRQIYQGQQVESLAGFAASEAALKRELGRGFRYGVIATHGVLDNEIPYIQQPALVLSQVIEPETSVAARPDAKPAPQETPKPAPETASPPKGSGGLWADWKNRIGALFAAKKAEPAEPKPPAASAPPPSQATPADDSLSPGFLTLTEVMSLKIDSDLIALTACNTGVGQRLHGEGVMGMGRAFQYAGVKSVLMSLWSVQEDSTNLLAEKFFTHLREGKDKLEALRLARTDLRQAGYEHPFFWAPFILVGESK